MVVWRPSNLEHIMIFAIKCRRGKIQQGNQLKIFGKQFDKKYPMNHANIKKGFHTTRESEHGIYFGNHNVAKQDRMTSTQVESNF